MSNTDVRAKAGRGSLVVENHDLFADIEQDRFVSSALDEKRFIFVRFPQPLEQAYTAESQVRRSKAMANMLVFNGFLMLMFGLYGAVSGASLSQLQWLIPAFAVLVLGLFLRKSEVMGVFNQVYLVLLAAALGISTHVMSMELAVSLATVANGGTIDAINAEVIAFGFAFYSLSILVMASRAPMELPTLVFVILAAGLSWYATSAITTSFAFYYAVMAVTAATLWVWSVDMQRRDYLQRFVAAPGRGSSTAAPKESERARQLVVLDNQTGLANNTSFMRFFSNEWRRAFRARQSVSLIMIHLGVSIEKLTEHAQLDRVLTELQRYSRRPGDLVGKLDGQRFAVLLSNTDIANSRRLAESLLEHLHGLDLGKDGILKVYMGVASTLPMPNMTHEDLLNKALEALSAAQENPAS